VVLHGADSRDLLNNGWMLCEVCGVHGRFEPTEPPFESPASNVEDLPTPTEERQAAIAR
jgi:hypothetical protein